MTIFLWCHCPCDRSGQGFLCVFSLTDCQTLQDIQVERRKHFKNSFLTSKHFQTIYEQIVRVKDDRSVPIVLVGNKVDLESQREVPTVEGMALAQIWGCPFVEASAKNRMNVNEVFAETVREMNMKPDTKDREIICTCCCVS